MTYTELIIEAITELTGSKPIKTNVNKEQKTITFTIKPNDKDISVALIVFTSHQKVIIQFFTSLPLVHPEPNFDHYKALALFSSKLLMGNLSFTKNGNEILISYRSTYVSSITDFHATTFKEYLDFSIDMVGISEISLSQ